VMDVSLRWSTFALLSDMIRGVVTCHANNEAPDLFPGVNTHSRLRLAQISLRK
jgi:hypothetical protein